MQSVMRRLAVGRRLRAIFHSIIPYDTRDAQAVIAEHASTALWPMRACEFQDCATRQRPFHRGRTIAIKSYLVR